MILLLKFDLTTDSDFAILWYIEKYNVLAHIDHHNGYVKTKDN